MSEHTPFGLNHTTSPNGTTVFFLDGYPSSVAAVYPDQGPYMPTGTARRVAALFIATTDLLEACKAALQTGPIYGPEGEPVDARELLRAAIAKAEPTP